MDDAKLNQASNNLVELRGDTDNADKVSQEDTFEAITGLNKNSLGSAPTEGAWLTAGGLSELDTRWGQQVINLKTMLQSISEKIHDTRGNYTRREDHERAQNDRSMMSDFG
ncbi:hypothetical protein [Streptomyces sp. NBC_01304]|uniref:hypothetical protein n=1 Tax=Streptomyces sp. NBC_01304 TaxID=2903818 RepID=UPI002E12EB42|nr:hypothetical protein OG430_15310 [Streptomyces sp. NBC_01304]